MKRRDAIKRYALAQLGGPYIYGATAKPCTPAYRRELMAQYPDYAASIRKYCPVLSGKQGACVGCGYNGKAAHDCAQLTRHAARAAGLTLPSGATSQWVTGNWADEGLVANMPRDEVCMVYRQADGKMQHTGVYTGDGMVVDARGHAYGVVQNKLEAYAWTHYAILPGMDGEIGEDPGPVVPEITFRPTLRKNDAGNAVMTAQWLLMAHGYALPRYGTDGKYGDETIAAVKAFQRDKGLDVDGVVGPKTWAALLNEPIDGARYVVTISGVDAATAKQLLESYPGATSEAM